MNLADWRCSYCSKKPLSFLPINVPWTSVQRENHCLTCTSSCLQRQIAFQKKCRKQLQELDFNQELQLEEQLYSPRLAEPEFKWITGDHVYVKVGKTEHPALVISKPYLFDNDWVVDIIWMTTPERKAQRVSCRDCTGKLYDMDARPRREKRQPNRYAGIVPNLATKVEGKGG
jgi:hypothetical protein